MARAPARLSATSRRGGWWLLALTAIAIAVLLLVALGKVPATSTAPAAGGGDLASYQRIIERMRGGEGYYPAAHAVLVADGYGTRSVFNWRTPAWPMLLAALPAGVVQGGLGALALGGLLLVFRAARADGGLATGLVASLSVGASLAGIAAPESLVFAEVPAGTLLLVGVAAYANGWRAAGLVALLAALFLRELAAPAVLVALLLAARQRRWGEVMAWGAGLVAYAAYFGWHWGMVSQQLGPMDRAYGEGWVQFGGLGFLLATAGFNGLWSLGPDWLPAVLLPLGLLGLWHWRGGTLALATVVAYLLAFAVVGKPFNLYWGALYTPLLMLGLGWVPVAVLSPMRQP